MAQRGRRNSVTTEGESAARPDIVAFWPRNDDRTCWHCGGTGDLLVIEGSGPVCLDCACLDDLVYLPRGDVALMAGLGRDAAREAVAGTVDGVLSHWRWAEDGS